MKDAQTFKEGSEVYIKGKVEKIKGNNLLIELAAGAPNMVVVDFANHEDRALQPADGNMSDGYHTFNELYQFRMALQANWFNALYAAYANEENSAANPTNIVPVKSWRHSDGELCFGKENYFVVVAELPTGQVTNHYKGQYWDLFKIPEVETAPEWDGHTPEQSLERMLQWAQAE